MRVLLGVMTSLAPVLSIVLCTLLLADGRVVNNRATKTTPDSPLASLTTDYDAREQTLETNGRTALPGVVNNQSGHVPDENNVTTLTIDEMIALADQDGPQSVSEEHLGASRQELDMWLTRDQDEAIHGRHAMRQKRKAHWRLTYRWANNQVVYRRAPGVFDVWNWGIIEDAMREWEDLTCLTFKEDVDQTHRNYAYFVNGSGCSSYVGMVNIGQQKITLGPGCVEHRVVLHEIGHAIGWFHEHNRPDRDEHVTIEYANVGEANRMSFDRLPAWLVNYYGVPYDFYSVMHYGQYAFTKNWKRTIKSINPAYQGVFGRNPRLSFHDVMQANRMYQCDAGCDQTIACPQDAYRGKDCQCYCRGPNNYVTVQRCGEPGGTATPTGPTTTPFVSCVNLHPNCVFMVSYCNSHPDVRRQCPKSCGNCGTRVTTLTSPPPTTTSTEATTSSTSTTPTTATGTPTDEPCRDLMPRCPVLARPQFNHYCDVDKLKEICRKSCENCGHDDKTTVQSTTKRPPTTTTTTTTTTTQSTQTSSPPCQDDSRSCSFWGGVPGLCRVNPAVRRLCQKSCVVCTV